MKWFFVFLFIPIFGFSQQLKITNQREPSSDFRCVNYINGNLTPCTYFTQLQDTILVSYYSNAFSGVSWSYKKQCKDLRYVNFKYTILRSGTGTNKISLGVKIWKNGFAVPYDMSEFSSYYSSSNSFMNYNTYFNQTKGNIYEKRFIIDFSKLPQYDSLAFFISAEFSISPIGIGAIFKFNVNDFYVEPKFNQSGVTKLNIENGTSIDFFTDMYLPKYIYIAQGNSIQIYNDNVAYIPVNKKDKLHFDWSESTIGVETNTHLNIKAKNVGTYIAKVRAIDTNGLILDSALTTIVVKPKLELNEKKILAIGNSLTQNGWSYMQKIIDDSLNLSLTNLGTRGIIPYKHEGFGGWKYQTFCNIGSPFFYNGKIDFKKFVEDSISNIVPDVIRLSLGINECFSQKIDTILYWQKKLLDSCLNQLNTPYICISTPTSACNTYDGWIANYTDTAGYEIYIKCIRGLNKKIYERYDNNIYSNRVFVNYDTFVIDRDSGFPKVDGIHTNAVHPSSIGYKELIRGTLNTINRIYQP